MTEGAKHIVDALRNSYDYSERRDAEAADLIESLSDMLELVMLERDAAVVAAHGVCKACIHFSGHYPSGYIMSCCKFEECVYGMGEQDAKDHWQWRGVGVEG